MDSSKIGLWIILFKKFSRLRVKITLTTVYCHISMTAVYFTSSQGIALKKATNITGIIHFQNLQKHLHVSWQPRQSWLNVYVYFLENLSDLSWKLPLFGYEAVV